MRCGRLTVLIAVTAVVLMVLLPMAYGAEAPTAPGPEAAKSRTLFDEINAGGFIGYVIMLLGVIGIALGIEHLITIRRAVIMPPDVLADVEASFEKEEYEQAIALCEERPTLFTNVLAAGLARINAGYKQMDEAMAEAGEEAASGLQHKISYLSLIANIAPMLGLLGTVQGMIGAFQQIEISGGTPKPAELAGNIQLALVTTFQGLAVAIPIMMIYHFVKNKMEKIILEVGAVTGELMARFRPVE